MLVQTIQLGEGYFMTAPKREDPAFPHAVSLNLPRSKRQHKYTFAAKTKAALLGWLSVLGHGNIVHFHELLYGLMERKCGAPIPEENTICKCVSCLNCDYIQDRGG